MSNPTPKNTQTPIVEGTVVTETPAPATEEAPKAPSKLKHAIKHPIQTVKKHSTAAAALAGGATVAVAALLLSARNATTEQGEVTETPTPENNVVDFPVAD